MPVSQRLRPSGSPGFAEQKCFPGVPHPRGAPTGAGLKEGASGVVGCALKARGEGWVSRRPSWKAVEIWEAGQAEKRRGGPRRAPRPCLWLFGREVGSFACCATCRRHCHPPHPQSPRTDGSHVASHRFWLFILLKGSQDQGQPQDPTSKEQNPNKTKKQSLGQNSVMEQRV